MKDHHPDYPRLAREQGLSGRSLDPLSRVCEKHQKAHVNCGHYSSCPTCAAGPRKIYKISELRDVALTPLTGYIEDTK